MFGFLVWELKENWRLYAVNRPPNLQPVIVGHHGETIIRFMRPGFRSGTLPKLYAKLRKAHRQAFSTGQWRPPANSWPACTMSERTLAAVRRARVLLIAPGGKRRLAIRTALGRRDSAGHQSHPARVVCADLGEQSLWIALEEHSGWLVAAMHERGWLDRLGRRQRRTLANALAGFYKLAGVDLVREQLDAQLQPGTEDYRIDERG